MSTCFRLEAGVNKPTNQHTIAFIALTLLVRKSIQSVKKLNDVVLAWLSVWSKMLMICMWSSWWHYHPIISCFIKTRLVWPFCCRLIQVVLEKRPLSGCLWQHFQFYPLFIYS